MSETEFAELLLAMLPDAEPIRIDHTDPVVIALSQLPEPKTLGV